MVILFRFSRERLAFAAKRTITAKIDIAASNQITILTSIGLVSLTATALLGVGAGKPCIVPADFIAGDISIRLKRLSVFSLLTSNYNEAEDRGVGTFFKSLSLRTARVFLISGNISPRFMKTANLHCNYLEAAMQLFVADLVYQHKLTPTRAPPFFHALAHQNYPWTAADPLTARITAFCTSSAKLGFLQVFQPVCSGCLGRRESAHGLYGLYAS